MLENLIDSIILEQVFIRKLKGPERERGGGRGREREQEFFWKSNADSNFITLV